jgi:two-component system NtrC family sensor kinase
MRAGDTTLVEGPNPRSDEAFQKLLLRFSAAAAQGSDAASLIRLFCHETRDFFQVSGVYFWQCLSADEMVGAEADGIMADRFRGLHLKATESAVTGEAIRRRRTIFVNFLDAARYPRASEFHARALMAAPLVVSNEVLGAVAFLHDAEPGFFNEDLAAKATIVAGQLGSLLEARRLTEVSREDHRRAEILAEVAHALHGNPDVAAVIEALADRIRVLLRARLVCVFMRRDGPFELRGVAAENATLANSARARHDRTALRFAADVAARSVAAGEPITVTIDPASHSLGDLVPAGMLLAAPFRTSRTQGAILVYPRADGIFTVDERSLVSAIAGFGAVAVANAELYSTARNQAHELHQLLEISSELRSIGNLAKFLEAFVVRAADFLGFARCFIGLLEEGKFHVRLGADKGEARHVDLVFPEGIATRDLRAKEVFWTDDAGKLASANTEAIAEFNIRQILAVPLLGSNGEVMGMFGMLDRLDQAGISEEDVRRARALAAQVSVALEVMRNLDLSEEHRKHAEALMGLSYELSSLVHLPDFNRRFLLRAAELAGVKAAALALFEDSVLGTTVLHDISRSETADRSLERRLSHALSELLAQHPERLCDGPAANLLGTALAAALDWQHCTILRLHGATEDSIGVLCLADRSKPLTPADEQLLHAIASHASVALENARLFTRMDKANRHWMEIFDAITDFIVVHDESKDVLRVNRSLAEFIGVPPSALIGVNMRALVSLASDSPAPGCPFCRSSNDGPDEYVHQVFERMYLVSTSRIHASAGEGQHTMHVLKDVTDRREAERRYRELFDNIQEGLFFAVPDGHFIEVNDALVRMLGYADREELLNVDITTQLYTSPERLRHLNQVMQQQGVLRNHEEVLRRKDGGAVHVLINAFAVPDAHGQVLQYRGLMLDITGLKTYQAELQHARDFSEKILNNTQSLILVVDTAGLISYANRRWYDAGYEQRQLVGCPVAELVSPGRRAVLAEALNSTLSGHPVDNLDLQVLRGDGRVGQFSVNLSPMRDEQGIVTSIVVVMTDITDSAMLQSKLIHAEKMAAVGQLVSGVAHEVNNPLTAILGFADLLIESPDTPESNRKDLRVILQEAQRTKQIVQNLLSFARQMPPQRKPVQLNGILRRTIQLRAYDFNSHGVEIVEHLDESLPQVVGDSHQLQQVFLNIMNNAYDAVRETGRPARIEIMTASLGTYVEVSFRDNGQGISHPDRIFDPFFTTKDVGKGTGLGLSICYGIVREHGGEILCHNNSGTQGATFIVRLPSLSESASKGVAAGVLQR